MAGKYIEPTMTGDKKGPGDAGIILFDGVCNLCERSVQFVIRHDPEARFMFAPLQSGYARALLEDPELGFEELQAEDLDSFVLVADGKAYVRSDAWLRICRRLDGWPGWLGVFRVVPRFIRDWVYDFIGRHRYQWFGEKSECMIPTTDIQRRFKQ